MAQSVAQKLTNKYGKRVLKNYKIPVGLVTLVGKHAAKKGLTNAEVVCSQLAKLTPIKGKVAAKVKKIIKVKAKRKVVVKKTRKKRYLKHTPNAVTIAAIREAEAMSPAYDPKAPLVPLPLDTPVIEAVSNGSVSQPVEPAPEVIAPIHEMQLHTSVADALPPEVTEAAPPLPGEPAPALNEELLNKLV